MFLPPCDRHLTPPATGSLKPSLLVFSAPGGLNGNERSCLFFTRTNTSEVATYTCNTELRVSPHNIVNHTSHQEATIHRSLNHTGPHCSLGCRVIPGGYAAPVLTVYFDTPNMFITLWFEIDNGTNPPLGTLMI
jgi:hypothetical protein